MQRNRSNSRLIDNHRVTWRQIAFACNSLACIRNGSIVNAVPMRIIHQGKRFIGYVKNPADTPVILFFVLREFSLVLLQIKGRIASPADTAPCALYSNASKSPLPEKKESSERNPAFFLSKNRAFTLVSNAFIYFSVKSLLSSSRNVLISLNWR